MSKDSQRKVPSPNWLDRWLEVRWVAFVTWICMVAVGSSPTYSWLESNMIAVTREIRAHVSWAPSGTVQAFGILTLRAVLTTWFQPLILRLDSNRVLLWILAQVIAVCVQMPFWLAGPELLSLIVGFLAQCGGFGLCGAALIGRRSAPWMTVIGSVVYASIVGLVYWVEPNARWSLAATLGSVPYAAIILYGTHPITDHDRCR